MDVVKTVDVGFIPIMLPKAHLEDRQKRRRLDYAQRGAKLAALVGKRSRVRTPFEQLVFSLVPDDGLPFVKRVKMVMRRAHPDKPGGSHKLFCEFQRLKGQL